jgi:hypothetical protein
MIWIYGIIRFALLILTSQLFSLMAPAVQTEWPVGEVPKLIVVAPHSRIEFRGQPQSQAFKVTSQNPNLEIRFERKSDALQLWVDPKGSLTSLLIEGPSVPVEFHVYDGEAVLQNFSGEYLVHVHKGKAHLKQVQGEGMVHLLRGEIFGFDLAGKLRLDCYQCTINAKNFNGDLELMNHSGDSQIENLKGILTLKSNQGSLKASQIQGNFEFDILRTQVAIQKFQGRVEGKSVEGPVQIGLSKQYEVRIKSQSAKISLNVPTDSGSYMQMSTGGDIFIPSPLRVQRGISQKSFFGRLLGPVQNGVIAIQSVDGAITVK